MTLAVPSPFPSVRVTPLEEGTRIERIHDRRFKGDEFNPGLGNPTRFAPLHSPLTGAVPTLYAASNFTCATYESILHDVPVNAGPTTIGWHRVDPVDRSILRLNRALMVAQLNEPDLKRMGTSRSLLLDSPPEDYAATAAWALALYDSNPHVAGMVWTSSKDDKSSAFLFFGDRVGPGDLEVLETQRIREQDQLLDAVRLACVRIGCAVIW